MGLNDKRFLFSHNISILPSIISILGLTISALMLCEFFYVLVMPYDNIPSWGVGYMTSIPFVIILIGVDYLVSRFSLSEERYDRIAYWFFGGTITFIIINLLLMIAMGADVFFGYIGWFRWALSLGGGTGLLIGVYEARGIEEAVTAERERIRAEQAEAKEELLTYLNSVLRHEVLNTATVVMGTADLAMNKRDSDEELIELMERIMNNTQDMERVVEDVRVLLRATKAETTVNKINITEIIQKELDQLQEVRKKRIQTHVDVFDNAFVLANEPVRRVFRNLFENAIEYNESPTPRISVEMKENDGNIVILVSDNGDGIAESEQETLFEKNVNHTPKNGLGLPLTQTLLQSYNGNVELLETGNNGTTFRIELPKAEVQQKQESKNKETKSSKLKPT